MVGTGLKKESVRRPAHGSREKKIKIDKKLKKRNTAYAGPPRECAGRRRPWRSSYTAAVL